MSQEMRLETEAEHLARDIRECRFPNQSERKMVPAENDSGYLIWKQGAFYRPNSQGYTTSAIQAGRYSLADAISITHPNGPDGPRDGMGYVHESEVVDADWQAYSALLAEIAAMQSRAEAAELREKALLDGTEINRKTTLAHNASHARQIAAKDAEIARLKSDRPFIIGANHGYETAMEQVAEEARRYASHYAEATDGRNTFTLFAEWADRAALKGDTHE